MQGMEENGGCREEEGAVSINPSMDFEREVEFLRLVDDNYN